MADRNRFVEIGVGGEIAGTNTARGSPAMAASSR